MARMILPTAEMKEVIRERRERGIDRFDEVWNGTYVMAPPPSNEHSEVSGDLVVAFVTALRGTGMRLYPGCGISDRREGWTKNYRVPDISVFLPGNLAEDCGTHWRGGPDLAVEVISPNDRSRKKLGFYASVGVRELLLVDRDPWRLELYRLSDGELRLAGMATPEMAACATSEVTGLELRLVAGESRPRIELRRPSDGGVWLA